MAHAHTDRAWIATRNLKVLKLWNGGGVSQAALAQRFGLTETAVGNLLKKLADGGHEVRTGRTYA